MTSPGAASSGWTSIGYADPDAPVPTLGTIGVPERADDRARLVTRVRIAAAVPAAISLGAHWLFLLAYWIPETAAFPAHQWWLSQLSPLVAESVTSAGRPQVDAQAAQLGLGGELLLLASLALLLLVRHPGVLGRGAALLPAGLGTLVAAVVTLALLLGGEAGHSGLALLLLAVWVWAAVYAALECLLVDVQLRSDRRWGDGVPWLAAYAVIALAPTAVGRALFGGDLRDAAATLSDNTVALRLAALATGANVLLYLAGLLLGVAVWAVGQCWPPRRDRVTALRVLVAVVALLATAGVGAVASSQARERAAELRFGSPADGRRFGCGSAQTDQPTQQGAETPARTLVITGITCKTVTTFEGYRQLSSRSLPFSLSPVSVRTPDGDRVAGRVASARYGDVLVVTGTSRLDTAAEHLLALRVTDGTTVWTSSCSDQRALRVRFAGVSSGDDPARGHVTRPGEPPQVVAVCGDQIRRLQPDTGRRVP